MKRLKRGVLFLAVRVAVLAIAPLFVSLDDPILRIEQEISGRLGEPVRIAGLTAPVAH